MNKGSIVVSGLAAILIT